MVNKEFAQLCSRAWALQILIYIFEQRDPRVSPIAHHFSTGRTSISAALGHLLDLGYVQRNSGHGHPMRPAYVLTGKGRKIARWATRLDELLLPADWVVARKSWALPVMRQAITSHRFGEIRANLQPLTDRALSSTLKMLGEYGWLVRRVDGEATPPLVEYCPGARGQILVPCLQASLRL